MKCEHIRLAHCVAKTGQVWILCNFHDQYIGPLRLVNHTRHLCRMLEKTGAIYDPGGVVRHH